MANENQNYNKIPLPTDAYQERLDKEFLAQFELDPTVADEPIQYCFEVGGIPTFPKGDLQANKGLQKNGKTFAEVLFIISMNCKTNILSLSIVTLDFRKITS